MVTRLSTAARSGSANGVVDLLDAGPGPGTVQIRTGAQPASVGTAATGTLLGTLTLADPAFGDASSGVATANAIVGDNSADAGGTPGWFRAFDSTGVAVIDGAISLAGEGGEMIVDKATVIAGGTIDIVSWTVTQPAG